MFGDCFMDRFVACVFVEAEIAGMLFFKNAIHPTWLYRCNRSTGIVTHHSIPVFLELIKNP